jgi:hypothetical protein
MRLASVERLWGSLLRQPPLSTEAGMPLTCQSTDSIRRELCGLVLEVLHHLAQDREQWRALGDTV